MRNLARLALVALAPACSFPPQYCEGEAIPAIETPSTSEARVVAQVLPRESSAVDILFVIDDSLSMKDEQEQLGIWSSEMFDVLSSTGELPDLHIGVTSSSLPIAERPGCTTSGTMRVLKDVAGPDGRIRDYSGTLTEAFAKLARVGASGCGFEQPFKATRQALSTAGFLRPEALLLVVFVTDEDDCSAVDPTVFTDAYADSCTELGTLTSYRCFEHGVTCYDGKGMRAFGERRNCKPNESSPYMQSVSGFADYLKGLKKDPAQVIVAGIYGKPNGINAIPDEKITRSYTTPRLADVCGGRGKEGTGATPAVRMNALMAEFGGRASQSSICESELAWAMRDVGLITRGAATRSRCLRGALVDTDAAPGVQPRCRVLAGAKEVPFTVGFDAACAETETQLAVEIDEAAVTVTVTCDVDNEELLPSSGESI